MKQQADHAKEVQAVDSCTDGRNRQLQEQAAAARDQVRNMTFQNEALLEQVHILQYYQGVRCFPVPLLYCCLAPGDLK